MLGYQSLDEAQNSRISFLKVAYTVLSIAAAMAISYTNSATAVVGGDMVDHVPGNRQNNLAASALIMPMFTTMVSITVAVLFSMSIYTNDRRGQLEEKITLIGSRQKTQEEAEAIITLQNDISGVLKAGLMLGVPNLPLPMLAMFFSGGLLEHGFGQDHEIAEQAQMFLRPYSFALIGFAARIAFEQILFSFEKQKLVMTLAVVSFAIGSGCAYLLCFGAGAVPAMGVPGIAYGFLIESYLTAIFFAAALYFNQGFKNFNFFKQLCTPYNSEDWHRVRELARAGLPMLATTASQVAAPFVINIIAGRLGAKALAIQSYSSWLSFGLLIPLLALGQAVAQETNRWNGRAKQQAIAIRARGEDPSKEIYFNTAKVAHSGLAASGLAITTLCAVVLVYPQVITDIVSNLDSGDGSQAKLAQNTVRITAAGIIFDTLCNTMMQTLRSLNDNVVPMGIAIATLWTGVGIAACLALTSNLGVYGLSIGYLAGNLLGSAMLGCRFHQKTQLATLAGEAPKTEGQFMMSSCWHRLRQSGCAQDDIELSSGLPLLGETSAGVPEV